MPETNRVQDLIRTLDGLIEDNEHYLAAEGDDYYKGKIDAYSNIRMALLEWDEE